MEPATVQVSGSMNIIEFAECALPTVTKLWHNAIRSTMDEDHNPYKQTKAVFLVENRFSPEF